MKIYNFSHAWFFNLKGYLVESRNGHIPSTVMKVAQRTSDIGGYAKDYTSMWSYYEYGNVEQTFQLNIEELN